MSCNTDWLPPLIYFNEFGGDWESYLDAIYEHFRADFIYSKPTFNGRKLALKRHPVSQGKEATFWHLISEGANEDERTPDFRRCERIRWPRPVIDNSQDGKIKMWCNKRHRETRICLWLEDQDYLVVLADRGHYILPWTAYLVVQPHRRRKLQREYETYWNNQA